MNTITVTAPAAAVDSERPLNICICPFGHDYVDYQGTRAQLEAEDLIPAGTVWPDRDQRHSWTLGGFRFSLRRIRPADLKVPKKVWIEGDWWTLRSEPDQVPAYDQIDIRTKVAELAAAVHRHSPAGRAEFYQCLKNLAAARDDEAFQSFKDLIVPSRKKPSRASKANAG